MPANAGAVDVSPSWLWIPGVNRPRKSGDVWRFGERIVLARRRYEYLLELAMVAIKDPERGLQTDYSYACNPRPEEGRRCDPDAMARNLARYLRINFPYEIQTHGHGYGFVPALGTPCISPRVLEQSWVDCRILNELRIVLRCHERVTQNI
jgi:hypothetical protein